METALVLPYFLFEDEKRKGAASTLKGVPVALVQSSVEALSGKFLTAVTPKFDVTDAEKRAASRTLTSRVEKELKSPPKTAKEEERALLKRAILGEIEDTKYIASLAESTTACDTEQLSKKRARKDVVETPVHTTHPRFIKLPPGSWFEQIPLYRMDDPTASKSEYRHTQYIAGPAGCGKSVLVAGLVTKFRLIWPDYPVFGVCKTTLEDDRAYAGIGIRQVPLEMMKSKKDTEADGHLKDLFGDAGCLLLFDDWDSFAKKERATVLQLMTDVLNLGRKMRISVIVTSHRITNYLETRAIIEESEFVTLFPQDTLKARLEYLGDCIGLPPGLINSVRALGRSFTVHKRAPMYILSGDQCRMLD